MTLYNLHTIDPDSYRITKFDDDLNPIADSSYILIPSGDDPSIFLCGCPAGARPSCRHRDMLPEFLEHPDRIDSNWFLEYSAIPGYKSRYSTSWRQYVGPFAHDGEVESEDPGVEGDGSEEQDESASEEIPEGYIPFASDKSESGIAQTEPSASIPAGVPSFRRRL